MWVADAAIAGSDLYTLGTVIGIDEKGKVTVETSNGSKASELQLPQDECHRDCEVNVPDHCQLMYLSQPTLLENTRVRYVEDKIYTYVGSILVAVNPFRFIDGIYTTAVMEQCKGKKLYNAACGPHVYAMSEQAYVSMKKTPKDQCIVVSGESGAGKTEANRQLMNYLVWRGTDSDSEDTLTQKIMDTNPVLEAFGNAKTTRNNNSSRFGRYVLVRFNDDYEVVGAQVRVFLLERSRVTSTSKALERSYHVLYELCCGGTPHTHGHPPDYFYYLSLSGQIDCPRRDDEEEFQQTSNGLLSIGLSDSELNDLWAFVGGLLYLGNIQFGSGENAVIDAAGPTDAVRIAEGLLGVGDMMGLLTTRQINVNGEVSFAQHKPPAAGSARDALVKIMFARLFEYLVVRINRTTDDTARAKRYIGLLDVYGFEFFEVNSFEQLCINFANEKLQQFFLTTVFASEASTYKEEGIPWTPVAYQDNKAQIELCEHKDSGIFKLLDAACKTPNAKAETFCKSVHDKHGKSSVLAAPKLSKKEQRSKDDHFIVKHFAGDVIYFAGGGDEPGFMERNNDTLAKEVEEHLLKSSKPLVVEICTPEAPPKPTGAGKGGGKKGGGTFASVGDKFVKSLGSLMAELQSLQAHFVRCIKSNPAKEPRVLHGASVIDQLRMSGTLDAVKLIQAGYPTRIPYESIHSRYKEVLKDAPGIDVAALTPAEFCEAVSEACGVSKSEFALGTTRMFFRMGAAAFLEELAEADPAEIAPKLIEMFGVFEQKRKAKPLMEKTVLMWLHTRRYAEVLKVKRVRDKELLVKAQEAKVRADQEKARKEEEERRRREQEEARRKEDEAKAAAEAAEKAAAEAAAKGEADAAAAAAAGAAAASEAEAKAKAAAEAKKKEAEALVAAAATSDDAAAGAAAADAAATLKKEADAAEAEVAKAAAATKEAEATAKEAAAVHAEKVEAVKPKSSSKKEEAVGATKMLSDVGEMIAGASSSGGGASHADLEKAAAAAGGVPSLIELAGNHADSREVQTQFADVVRELCSSDEIAIDLSNAGGTDALIRSAQKHFDALELQVAVAGALRSLSEMEVTALDIATGGGIEVLVDACARHPDAPAVASRVAGVLWGLSVHDDIGELIFEMGCTDNLLELAKKHPTDAEVQAAAAGALRNLAANDKHKQAIADKEGVELLLHAAKAHREHAGVCAQVAGALRNISLSDDIAKQVAREGGVAELVAVSSQHVDNPKIQAGVAGALRNLSVNDEIAEQIASAGGVEALVVAAQTHPTNADVQSEVAGSLWGLTVNDAITRKIAAATGTATTNDGQGVAILVAAAKNHLNNLKVIARVAGALRKLSELEENKKEVAETGGVETLVKAAEVHLDNGIVQAAVAGVLSNLSVDDEIEKQIASIQGIECLINGAKAHLTNAKVQGRVMRALTNLSVHDANKERIASTLGIATLIQSAAAHPDAPEVQAGVAAALRNLSINSKIAETIAQTDNAVSSLVTAAKKHPKSAIVQAGVAGALRNLSANEGSKKTILDAGAVAVLDAAAAEHPENEKLQTELAGARKNLVGVESAPGPASAAKKGKKKLKLPAAPDVSDASGDVPLSQRKNSSENKKEKKSLFGGLSRKKKK